MGAVFVGYPFSSCARPSCLLRAPSPGQPHLAGLGGVPAATCLPHPPLPTPASSSSSAPDFLWGPRANSWSWLVESQFQILLASRIWGLVASVQLVPPSSLVPLLFHQPMQINGNFCGLVLNQPLGGLHVIEGLPLLADSSDGMASVAAYTYRQHSVVFIGTRSGSLKKVGCGLEARTYTLKSQTGHCPWGKADFPGRVPGLHTFHAHQH